MKVTDILETLEYSYVLQVHMKVEEKLLEWCLESLVQEGDELIVFRGVEDVLGDFLFRKMLIGFFLNRERS